MAGFTILTVCTGNLCRSPLAEQLLRAGLREVPEVTIESAGVLARDGDPMPEQAAALSRRFGGDPDGHAARRLVPPAISGAGLVLGMAREHRRSIVSSVPSASRRTFALLEFARLSRALTPDDLARIDELGSVPERLAEAVDLVAGNRGLVESPEDPAADDIVDPYRRSDEVYERSAAQLVPAVAQTVAVLRRAAAGQG